MFVSHSEHEFHLPDGVAEPGIRQWRQIEFELHVPWFILTVAEPPFEDGAVLTRTLFIAWEQDLVHALAATDASRLRGLVCMLPGWKSKTGYWASREVCEVWETQTEDGRSYMRFIDFEGCVFDGRLQAEASAEEGQGKLLLKLKAKVLSTRSSGQAAHDDSAHTFSFQVPVPLPQGASAVANETTLQPIQNVLEQLAANTFETTEEAHEWLRSPHPMFGGETPLQVAQTEEGARRVEEMLVALKYGGVA